MVRGSSISGWVYLVIACVALTTSNTCLAQITDDDGAWLALFTQGDVGESQFKWWFDGHARFLDDAGGFNQSIVRPGFGYSLGDRGAVWAGYGWIRTSPLTGASFDEHRVFSVNCRVDQGVVDLGHRRPPWHYSQKWAEFLEKADSHGSMASTTQPTRCRRFL